LLHETTDGRENIFLIGAELARLLKVIRKNVQQQFRIAVCIDMPMRLRVKEAFKFSSIDQITILMTEAASIFSR